MRKWLLIITMALIVLVIRGYHRPDKGQYDRASGTYINKKGRFSLKLPPEWRQISAKEALTCPTLLKEYVDQYYLFVTPTEPSDALFVINEWGLPSMFVQVDESWKAYVEKEHEQREILLERTNTQGELKMRQLGYNIADVYRENTYFASSAGPIEIYFYLRTPERRPELLQQFREAVKTLQGLRGKR